MGVVAGNPAPHRRKSAASERRLRFHQCTVTPDVLVPSHRRENDDASDASLNATLRVARGLFASGGGSGTTGVNGLTSVLRWLACASNPACARRGERSVLLILGWRVPCTNSSRSVTAKEIIHEIVLRHYRAHGPSARHDSAAGE